MFVAIMLTAVYVPMVLGLTFNIIESYYPPYSPEEERMKTVQEQKLLKLLTRSV